MKERKSGARDVRMLTVLRGTASKLTDASPLEVWRRQEGHEVEKEHVFSVRNAIKRWSVLMWAEGHATNAEANNR